MLILRNPVNPVYPNTQTHVRFISEIDKLGFRLSNPLRRDL